MANLGIALISGGYLWSVSAARVETDWCAEALARGSRAQSGLAPMIGLSDPTDGDRRTGLAAGYWGGASTRPSSSQPAMKSCFEST